MSKKTKQPKQELKNTATSATTPPEPGRRNFMLLGVGALAAAGVGAAAAYNAGWFDEAKPQSFASTAPRSAGKNLSPVTLPADQANALRAINEMVEHYARDLGNASALIHAVRAFGKGFKLADGTNAVEHLCTRYAADKEVNGKRFVFFKRDAEVHENSFLKTFLEAGVSLDQPVVAGANRYTLRDVSESARQLFRCDPSDLFKFDDRQFRYDPVSTLAHGRGELVHEHLPWGLIAFSILLPPAQATWTNAYGEKIELAAVLDRSLAEYESNCALGQAALLRGETAPVNFREKIKEYSCFGLHSVYGFLSCWQHGYTNNEVPQRLKQALDLATYRLKGDALASDQEYDEAESKAAAQKQGSPAIALEAFKQRARVKLLGHAFESINYAKLHKLVTFTPAQEQRIQAGEQAMYDSIVKLRALDWAVLRRTLSDKFISDIVIALGHATRAMKLLTPENPDTVA
ncbi:MAG: hypothetical protein HYR56_33860 [Acidobacteria bacterium]|nr:hypothetical protein [Acidobacteriota bacterium]MBI3424867.1 hypothetical protein [Acidobacteriota bacterium]